jgi:hypothetical protein
MSTVLTLSEQPRSTEGIPTGNRRYAMRTLGYISAATLAAASTALGLVAIMSLPDFRRYLKIRKM